MGKSPAQRAQEAAKDAVEQAMRQQKKLAKQIEKKAAGYEEKWQESTERLGSLTGTSMPEYVTGSTERFYDTLGDITAKYEPQMKGFQPNIINSPSTQMLNQYLMGIGQAYTQGLGEVGREMSGRLYETLNAPEEAFSRTFTNPAFENLRNRQYMDLVTKPPTVRSDVASMKDLYTYNV